MISGAERTVIVIEDEADIRELVKYHLEREGFAVREASDGEKGFELIRRERPALVVLDLMLPGTDGLDICRMVRADSHMRSVPIVMLTARGGEVDRVLGLEMGADDYVTKPFSPRELVARVKAVLRRSAAAEEGAAGDVYERGRLRVDFTRYEAWLEGHRLHLSLREFELLRFFVRNPERVFERLAILDLVWGPDTYVEPRTVDVHVRRLRVQIERNPSRPELIQTVRGVGYRFNEAALES